ncbi:hypothetical protein ACSQ67_015174 [Phaseolus vulgaris]
MDAHLLRALHKKGIAEPTPIQGVAIPLILVMLFSNFTFAIHHSTSLQPKLVHSLFPGRQGRGCTRQNRMCFVVIVSELGLRWAALIWTSRYFDLHSYLRSECLSGGILKAESISESLETLVLDEDVAKSVTRIVCPRVTSPRFEE